MRGFLSRFLDNQPCTVADLTSVPFALLSGGVLPSCSGVYASNYTFTVDLWGYCTARNFWTANLKTAVREEFVAACMLAVVWVVVAVANSLYSFPVVLML